MTFPQRLAALAAIAVAAGSSAGCQDSQMSEAVLARSRSLDLFNRRILPILAASNPSSCSECHLAGVDLKNYIDRDQARTFAALRAGGLINVTEPDESKILKLIARTPDEPSLVGAKARLEEFTAFREWIHAAIRDDGLMASGDAAELGPAVSVEVIRHSRRDRVLASFIDNFWSEVGRCAACHSPDKNSEQVAKHGNRVSWIRPGDPAATMQNLLDAELISIDDPASSMILLKPTLQVDHGGGQKMVVGDRTYRQFRRFIDDYAAVVRGRYKSSAELPPPGDTVSIVSEIWFKIENVPASFDKMVLQADLYRWNADDASWSEEPWATGDRQVFGKGQLWQQHLTLLAPRDSDRARQIIADQTLPPGRYLAKIYVDEKSELAARYPYELGPAEYKCEVEVDSTWPTGYGAMTVVRYPESTPP